MTRNKRPSTKCAIYTRKSTEEGLDREFNTLDAQRESGEAYIKSMQSEGWTCLATRYDDGGFTGGSTKRPALQRLLADIKAGKVDTVVVYKVDRLSRSLIDFSKLMEVFEAHKVAFVAVTQQINTATSTGRLMLNVLLSFAQFEREVIGERIRDKIAAQRRRGKWSGGHPVLGYDVDRSGNSPKLVVNAREAARVREVFDLYLSLGSLMPVVEELQRRRWRNKKWKTQKGKAMGGKAFDRGSLYALLSNPIYIGKVRHRDLAHPGEHEPIVADDVFQRVQAALRRNGCAGGGGTVRNRYGALLRGLLICKHCGHTMVHTFSTKGATRYRYYRCTHAIKNGQRMCASGSLPATEIERVVVEQIRCIGDDADLRAEVLRQANEQYESDLSELKREQTELKRELRRHDTEIRRLAAEGPVGEASAGRLADLHDRVGEAERRLKELKDLIAEHERNQVDEADVAEAFADFDNVWERLSPRERIQVLSLLVARVEYDVSDSTIAVSFHSTGLKTLANGQLGGAA